MGELLEKIKVLLVEDDEDDYVLIRDYFSEINRFSSDLEWVKSYSEGIRRIKEDNFDVYLIDYRLDAKDGISLIEEALDMGIHAPLILLTGQEDEEIDYLAMDVGASDYLVKNIIDSQVLERSIRYAINRAASLRALNEKEQKYRTLFEQSVDAIFLMNTNLCFVDVNNTMQRLFHCAKDDFIFKSVKDFMDDEKDFDYLSEKLKKEKDVKKFELNMKITGGKTLICQMTVSPLLDNQDQIYGYQGILRDISLRKRAEKELLMAEKLSMTGKIARSIAHEVRNPLTNLNLALEQLRDEIPEDNETAELYADIIKRNANRIEQLISEMLNSSKQKQLQLRTISLNDIVKEAIKLSRDRIRLSGIKLETNIEENIPQLNLDAELLRNALLNIIINAIEAMEQNQGVLKISTYQNDDHVCVSIRDNGKGISKEHLENLFDPFYTDKKSGMGLGLTSVQNIIHSHKGSIDVDSELGKGTTFVIEFSANSN